MFGFPFITSLVVAVASLALISLAVHRGIRSRRRNKKDSGLPN